MQLLSGLVPEGADFSPESHKSTGGWGGSEMKTVILK